MFSVIFYSIICVPCFKLSPSTLTNVIINVYFVYVQLKKAPYRLIAEVMFKTQNKMEILAQGQEKTTQHKGLVKRPLK